MKALPVTPSNLDLAITYLNSQPPERRAELISSIGIFWGYVGRIQLPGTLSAKDKATLERMYSVHSLVVGPPSNLALGRSKGIVMCLGYSDTSQLSPVHTLVVGPTATGMTIPLIGGK